MEKGGGGGGVGGDDSARAVGMCDRFLTFLTKNLSMNRQKHITEGLRKSGSGGGIISNPKNHAEEDEDEFAVKIEKAELELSHEEEGHRSFTATILEERSTDVRASDQQKAAMAEAGREVAAAEAAAAAVAAQGEKKVRKSVTIKEDREEAAGDKDKKSQLKKRQASSSSSSSGGQQVGAGGGEDTRPPPRWGLRPRMPAILRVPSNINEKSSTFIQERKRGFGAGGKPEK